jgi:protein translocation Sec62 family protein
MITGRSAMKALLSPAYAKLSTSKTSLHPKVTSDDEASLLLHPLISSGFFLRVERGGSITTPGPGGATAKVLAITPTQLFIPDDYYAWFYDADQTKMMLLAVGMVVVVLAAVMFPLWPAPLRIGVWYLSIAVLGLLGLLMAIAVFRLIFYVITIVVAKPGIWIFPELFADVGFVSCSLLLSAIAPLLTCVDVTSLNRSYHCMHGTFQSKRNRGNQNLEEQRNPKRINYRNRGLPLQIRQEMKAVRLR